MSYWKVAVEEATVNPQPRPLTPGYMEYQTILDEVFSDIRNGADVQEALNSAVARIDTEMAKYK
jgi:maltose-binding protein MalE